MSFDREQLKSYLPGLAVTIFGVTAVVILRYMDYLDGWWSAALIVLALLVWPIALVIDRGFKKRGQAVAPAAEPSAPYAPRKTNQSFPDLDQASALAIGWLREKLSGKESSSGKTSGKSWFGAKLGGDGDALYQRPWFVIAGPPASGKTSLLLSAGLNFHALQGQIRTEQNLLRPTTACEWRITDNLVLLDTAGRYQDEQFQRDHDEWLGFIDLVKRHRRRRPIDGLLLVVNTAQVINAERQSIEQQANILRDRLDELILQTRSRFPIYLVFTHTDQIAGFTEFFRNCDPSERGQVWGVSFKASEARNQLGKLDEEFNQLYDGLLRRRLVRLGIPDQPAEQARVFDFPFRFRDERRKFFWFISMLFQTRPHNKEQQPLLRGFYFTSSPAAPAGDGGQKVGPSYFTSNLFRTLLTGDRHLAAWLQPGRWMEQYARPVLLALAGFVLLFLTAGLLASYVKNTKTISKGQELGEAVLKAEKTDDGRVWAELDKLREFLRVQEEGPDLMQRFGLHVGEGLNQPLRAIYFEAISQRVFNRAIAKLESDLRDFAKPPDSLCGAAQNESAINCYDQNYGRLRALLMLSKPENAEPGFLENQLATYWQDAALAVGGAEKWSDHLRYYAQQSDRPDAPHWKAADVASIERAKEYLARYYPANKRAYRQILQQADQFGQKVTRGDFNIPSTPLILPQVEVPVSFTRGVYQDQLRDELKDASKRGNQQDPVLQIPMDKPVDPKAVREFYEQEYADRWEKFLGDIKVTPFTDAKQAGEALSKLSNDNSPLAVVLKTVVEETKLATRRENGRLDWLMSFFKSSLTSDPIAANVQNKFAKLAVFMGDDGNPKKTDNASKSLFRSYQEELSKLQKLVEASGEKLTDKNPELKSIEAEIGKLCTILAGDSSKAVIPLLMQPVKNLKFRLGSDEARSVEEEWATLSGSASALLTSYPFTRSATSEANPKEFESLLNPATGTLKKFEDRLKASGNPVFNNANGRWEKGQSDYSEGLVAYLNKLGKLRGVFFSEGKMQFNVNLTPTGTTVIDVNNGKLDLKGGRVDWPTQTGINVSAGQGNDTVFPAGSWMLFRMFDAGGAREVSKGNYVLSLNGKTVVLKPTGGNPFDRSQYAELLRTPPLREPSR